MAFDGRHRTSGDAVHMMHMPRPPCSQSKGSAASSHSATVETVETVETLQTVETRPANLRAFHSAVVPCKVKELALLGCSSNASNVRLKWSYFDIFCNVFVS